MRVSIALIVLLLPAISGCTSFNRGDAPGTEVRPSLHLSESSDYVWQDDLGQVVAKTHIDLTIEGPRLMAHITGIAGLGDRRLGETHVSPSLLNATYHLNASTGELEKETHHGYTAWPSGIHAIISDPGYAMGKDFTYDLYSENVARAFLPLGIQWPLLAGQTGSNSWGEAAEIVSTPGPQQWTATTSFDCQSACYMHEGTDVRTAHLSYTGTAGILPEQILASWEGTEYAIQGTQSNHTLGARAEGLTIQAPVIQPHDVATGTCNGVPCEDASWPERLSMMDGNEVVRSSPNWIAWSQSDSKHPVSFLVGNGDLAMNGNALADTRDYLFRFVDSETMAIESFSAFGAGSPEDRVRLPPTPGLLNPSNLGQAHEVFRNPSNAPGLKPVAEYALDNLDQLDLSIEDIDVYQVAFSSPVRFPDERVAAKTVLMGTVDEVAVHFFMSATTGQVVSIRYFPLG